eukprot:s22_g49.t1
MISINLCISDVLWHCRIIRGSHQETQAVWPLCLSAAILVPLISVVLVAESQHIEVMRLLSLLAPAVALVLDEKSLEAASSSRPVSKVVSLLQGMKEQLEGEASEEAELMEKYNCWCKENGEAKEKAILEATSRIEEWENRIAELSAMSSRLGTEYKNLQEEVDKNQASMDESMALRKKEVAKFYEEEKELFNSLNSDRSPNHRSWPSMRRSRRFCGVLLLALLALAPASLGPKRALQQLGKWTNQAVSAIGHAVLRSEDMDLATISGVEPDRPGGLSALAVGVVGNSLAVLLLVRYLERLRHSNPLLHEGNLTRLQGSPQWAVPWGSKEMLQQNWGWLRAAMSVNIDDVEAAAGLDAAMMVEFADLSMQILAVIGEGNALN